MEGFPLSNFSDFNYSNDNLSTNNLSTNNLSIMNQSNMQVVSWLPIITMKEELINHMKDTQTDHIILDESEETYLDNVSNTLIEFMKKFRSQLLTMNEAEKKMKECMNKTNKDMDQLSSFIRFMETMNRYEKCSDHTEVIEKELLTMSNEIKQDNTLKQVKESYILENKKFHRYLNIIKLFNQMNVGTTCSICLEENVDSYFNPCGHTACAKCCEKTLKMNHNDDICPLCRKFIQSIHKLYII